MLAQDSGQLVNPQDFDGRPLLSKLHSLSVGVTYEVRSSKNATWHGKKWIHPRFASCSVK